MGPDGSIYFFMGARNKDRMGEIFVSRFANGKNLEIECLEDPINSIYYEVDPVISPDGSRS